MPTAWPAQDRGLERPHGRLPSSPKFAKGTFAAAEILRTQDATTIIGGATVRPPSATPARGQDVASSPWRGGASLEFEGIELPGVAALNDNRTGGSWDSSHASPHFHRQAPGGSIATCRFTSSITAAETDCRPGRPAQRFRAWLTTRGGGYYVRKVLHTSASDAAWGRSRYTRLDGKQITNHEVQGGRWGRQEHDAVERQAEEAREAEAAEESQPQPTSMLHRLACKMIRPMSTHNNPRRVPCAKPMAGNWKMNKTINEAVDLACHIREQVNDVDNVDRAVCPPLSISPWSAAN